jgi:hypothetical protein
MATVCFSCGCAVTSSMFGEREILAVHHCEEHRYLFSDNKSLRTMASEIHALHPLPNPPDA